MVWAPVSGTGPDGTRCPGIQLLRSQKVADVTLDRCPECFGLWLGGGEFDALGGQESTCCAACGAPQVPRQSFCDLCLTGPEYRDTAEVELPFGLGGEPGDRTVQLRG